MNGIINVLKPPGMTSSNVVSDVKRLLGVKKVGHAGTLDPGAAGVLPVLVGKGTKLFDILANKDKEYIAEITFGISTDTQDAYGRPVIRQACQVEKQQFEAILPSFIGTQMQTPSAYSAIKIDGQKAYQIARKGGQLDLNARAREITIYSIELLEHEQNRFLIKVNCSKGTYIRQLAQQLGEAVRLPAYLSFLLRTASGEYRLEDAATIAELQTRAGSGDTGFLLPVESAFARFEAIQLSVNHQKHLMNGNDIKIEHPDCGSRRIYCGGEFYGVGQVAGGVLSVNDWFYGGVNG